MYAVIKTGGQQLKVSVGERVKVQLMADAKPGEVVEFDQVLLVSDGETTTLGKPLVATTKVAAEIVGHGRAKKIQVLKFRRRKHHMKQMGHRQWYTEVKITNIA